MTIISKLQDLAEATPDQVLFEEGDESLSAHRLYALANAVARQLETQNISPSASICIMLPRGLAATYAIYGVLMMGGRYIPIDSSSPQPRTRFIIEDADCACVIGSGNCPPWLSELNLAYLDINTISPVSVYAEISQPCRVDQVAALLYTSGSTGIPKGVAIPHRAILAFTEWGQQTFSIQSDDRLANLAPYQFDLSLFDLFTGPLAGARTIYIPEALKLSPGRMVDWLIENKISSWYTVPSILGFLVLKGGLAHKEMPQLRQILFAGEVFPTATLRKLVELLPHTRFYNLFGPTETNVCLYWPVNAEKLRSDSPIPIGHPACDASTAITKNTGELLVKGPCLMAGYWRNGKLDLPLDDQGWFHTGDKVSVNTEGEMEYHGRLDRMLKSAGYRIEPAEIESILNSAKGVTASAVIGLADPISGSRIAAAVAGTGFTQASLRKHLSEKLPTYMQPALYIMLDKLPLLINGKTDYRTITELFLSKNTT